MVRVYILLLPYTYRIYTLLHRPANTNTHLIKINSLLRLLVPEEVARHSVRKPPSVNYFTQLSNTYFSVLRGRMNVLGPVSLERRKVKKAWPFHTESTGRRGQSDFMRGLYMAVLVCTCKWWPAVQYAKLTESIFLIREKREAEQRQCMLQYFIP